MSQVVGKACSSPSHSDVLVCGQKVCDEELRAHPLTHSIIGRKLPCLRLPASMPDGSFGYINYESITASKWTLLFFYPKDFTFVCPTELRACSELSDQFKEAGCQIVGVSCDSQHVHNAWLSDATAGPTFLGPLKIPLASDASGRLAKSLMGYCDSVDHQCSYRISCLVDRCGIVKYLEVMDLPIGRSVPELLRKVEAFNDFLTTGGLCAHNHTKGQSTINA